MHSQNYMGSKTKQNKKGENYHRMSAGRQREGGEEEEDERDSLIKNEGLWIYATLGDSEVIVKLLLM